MLAPAIAKTSSFGSLAGSGRVGMVDTRDVAAVAASIAATPAPHAGKTYWLTGPETLSYSDAATMLSKALRRTITFHPLTFEEQKQAMIDAGLPETVAAMNAQALGLFAEKDSDWITDDVPSILWPGGAYLRAVRYRKRRDVLVKLRHCSGDCRIQHRSDSGK